MVALSSGGTAAIGSGTKRKTKPKISAPESAETAAEPIQDEPAPEANEAKRPTGAKPARPSAEPVSPGTSREAIAYTIVMQLAQAEGKLTPDDPQALPTFTRQWMFDAFTFAWKCLQVPKA